MSGAEADQRKFRRLVARGARAKLGNSKQIKAADPKTFVGSYHQRLRRRKIYELRMRNYTVREIQEETGLSQVTILADLRSIEAALQQTIDKGQADAILNERLGNLEAMRDICLEGIDTSLGNERVGYLNTLVKLEEQITKLLQDAGVLKRAPSKHELMGSDGMPLPVATPGDIHITIDVPENEPQEKIVRLQDKSPHEIRR